jgi:hypothetical protein
MNEGENQTQSPGVVVAPSQPAAPVAPAQTPAPTPIVPAPQPVVLPAQPSEPVPTPAAPTAVVPDSTPPPAAPVFAEDPSDEEHPDVAYSHDPISWTASEFIAHDKEPGWYGLLALGALVATGLVYLVTRDPISSTVILVGALTFGFYGARKPRQLQYLLSDHGLRIASRYYPFEQFRSFSVIPEGAFSSIVFMPLKRFAPLTTIYYAPEDEDKIIDLLSIQLPYVERSHDVVDRLMHRIRF